MMEREIKLEVLDDDTVLSTNITKQKIKKEDLAINLMNLEHRKTSLVQQSKELQKEFNSIIEEQKKIKSLMDKEVKIITLDDESAM